MDFIVADHGTIWTLLPLSVSAKAWAEENIDQNAATLGRSIAIEPRYIADIVDGIVAAGLTIGR